MRNLQGVLYCAVVLCLLLSSCKDRVVCPAYQSSFLLMPEDQQAFFSLFGEDSIPKGYRYKIKTNKYGGIVKISYRKRLRDLAYVPMNTLYPIGEEEPYVDSTLLAEIDYNPLSDSVSVSLDSASLYARAERRKGYNQDQRWYEENIEEITREDGVDPKMVFRKKGEKAPQPKASSAVQDTTGMDMNLMDPIDMRLEIYNDNGDLIESEPTDSTGVEAPIIEAPKKEEDTEKEDDGLDDF